MSRSPKEAEPETRDRPDDAALAGAGISRDGQQAGTVWRTPQDGTPNSQIEPDHPATDSESPLPYKSIVNRPACAQPGVARASTRDECSAIRELEVVVELDRQVQHTDLETDTRMLQQCRRERQSR